MGLSSTPFGPGMGSSWDVGATGAGNFAVGIAQSFSKTAVGPVDLS